METEKLVYFCHYSEKWFETKLLLHDLSLQLLGDEKFLPVTCKLANQHM